MATERDEFLCWAVAFRSDDRRELVAVGAADDPDGAESLMADYAGDRWREVWLLAWWPRRARLSAESFVTAAVIEGFGAFVVGLFPSCAALLTSLSHNGASDGA